MSAAVISAFVTLFVVIDPIGLGAIFMGLTRGMDDAARRRLGLDATLIAFAVLAGTALVGRWLLANLGISLAAFRIAGGLLLFAIAFEMVFERRQRRKAEDAEQDGQASIAAFPLAIPLMAGPGALTAMLLLSARTDAGPFWLALLIAILAVMLGAALVMFRASSSLERLLGRRGQAVFARLLGVLLAALAVQYVADGIRAFG